VNLSKLKLAHTVVYLVSLGNGDEIHVLVVEADCSVRTFGSVARVDPDSSRDGLTDCRHARHCYF
jgi:hypothetical protein